MRTTIETPIEAGRLPPEVRRDTPPDVLVRVSYEVVDPRKELLRIMEKMSEQARKAGLTEETLEELLRNDE